MRDVITDLRGEHLIGLTFSDKMGKSFVVEGRNGSVYTIRYTSGNRYKVKEGQFRTMLNVFDYDLEDFDEAHHMYWKQKRADYYLKNREKLLQDAKQWQKDNPEKAQHRNRRRRAKREQVGGEHTQQEIHNLLESQCGLCACCSTPLGEIHGKHLDHIMPITLDGVNSIDNLQWLCQFCNNSKGGKHPDEWNIFSQTEAFKERCRLKHEQELLDFKLQTV